MPRAGGTAETARLKHIADSLWANVKSIRSNTEMARYNRLAQVTLDTIVAFGAVVRVPATDAGLVRNALDTAASQIASSYGVSRERALFGLQVTLLPSTLWEATSVAQKLWITGWASTDSGWPVQRARGELRDWSADAVRGFVYTRVQHLREQQLDLVIRGWAGELVRDWRGDSAMWSDAARAMAVAASRPTRRCAARLGSCDVVLGLTPPSNPWDDWYDPSDVRWRVLRPREHDPDPPLFQLCERGQAAACAQYARQYTGAPILPSPPIARRLLLAMALRRGGPQAYSRLMADTTRNVGERLAAAADDSLPVLLRAFTDSLYRHRSTPPSVEAPSAWSVTLLAALCVVVTLRRRHEATR